MAIGDNGNAVPAGVSGRRTSFRASDPTRMAFFWLSAFFVVYCARPEDWIPGLKFLPLAKITAILALWGLAAKRRHPRAPHVIAAIVASGGAAVLQATPSGIGAVDATSMYHLGQTLAMLVLFGAVAVPATGERSSARARVLDPAPSAVERAG